MIVTATAGNGFDVPFLAKRTFEVAQKNHTNRPSSEEDDSLASDNDWWNIIGCL